MSYFDNRSPLASLDNVCGDGPQHAVWPNTCYANWYGTACVKPSNLLQVSDSVGVIQAACTRRHRTSSDFVIFLLLESMSSLSDDVYTCISCISPGARNFFKTICVFLLVNSFLRTSTIACQGARRANRHCQNDLTKLLLILRKALPNP